MTMRYILGGLGKIRTDDSGLAYRLLTLHYQGQELERGVMCVVEGTERLILRWDGKRWRKSEENFSSARPYDR